MDQKFPPRRPPGKGGPGVGWMAGGPNFVGKNLPNSHDRSMVYVAYLYLRVDFDGSTMQVNMTYMDGMCMVIHHYIPIIWDFPPRKGGDE